MANDPYSPLVQDLVPLNKVKYAARDYPSIFDSLLRRLKIEYADTYNDYATTTQGIMFLELMAFALQEVQWFLDRTASDSFLETARTRAAVARLVSQIGYKMRPAAASSTTVTLTFPDGTTGPFTMPARWRFQGPDGLVFESYAEFSQPTALGAGATIEIPVRQGQTRVLSYTGDGEKNQSYRMTNVDVEKYVANGAVDVWVDGSLWTENEFLEYEKTNQYEVAYNYDPPIVQFGDGIAGNVPPDTADIKLRFIIIDGEKGNVKSNTITSSIDSLIVGGSSVTFTVTNAVGSTGGTDPETADSARRLAPFSFAARNAAITEPDYEALSNSYTDSTYGSVAKSYAYNPRGPYEDAAFNELIDDVKGDLSDNTISMTAKETAAATTAADLSTPVTGLETDTANTESIRVDLASQVGTAKVQCTTASSNSTSAESSSTLAGANCADATTLINSVIAYVEAVGSATPTWTPAHVSAINSVLNSALSSVASASSNAADARSASGSASSALGTAINDYLAPALDSVENATPVSPAFTLPTVIASMTANTALIDASVLDLQSQLSTMEGEASSLEVDVNIELASMHERIGDLFSDDCQSNYVQVPILGLDVDGNYSAPSVGLMVGLQSHLNSIKEVTQNVEVIDGSVSLVPVDIEMIIAVNKDAYVEAEVVSDIVATVIGMLKGRDFNSPLYLSSLYENTMDVSEGIKRANIEITGPIVSPSVFDTEGNVVPGTNKIIKFGSLIIRDEDGIVLYPTA